MEADRAFILKYYDKITHRSVLPSGELVGDFCIAYLMNFYKTKATKRKTYPSNAKGQRAARKNPSKINKLV